MNNDTTFTLSLGPQHPAAHGVLRLELTLRGEEVLDAKPHIGYLHRGTEKLIEQKTYLQALGYFDRLDYVSPLSQEHTYVTAIEKLLAVTVPLRAQFIRVIFLELTRVMNHILSITTFAADLGALSPLLWGFEEREKIMEFCERVSGARLHCLYFRPGGVIHDVDEELLADILSFLPQCKQVIEDIRDLLESNPVFLQRTKGVGRISLEQAILYGLTGPLLRSCGVHRDLRHNSSYEIYNQLDFKVITHEGGDCYARYYVRINEIFESLRIVEQAINLLPAGEFLINDYKLRAPPRAGVLHDMEQLIHHFKFFSEGFSVPASRTYHSTETPKGEFGVYLVADGTNRPYRCKIRSPGFAALQALPCMLDHHLLADVSAILGSLDIVFGEIDR